MGTRPIGEDWIVAGAFAAGVDATFLPETSFEFAVNRRFSNAWVGGFRVRQRSYSTTSVESAAVLTEYYFGNYRLAHSLEAAILESDKGFVNTLALGFFGKAGQELGLILATGDEIEVVSPGVLLRTGVQSVALFGRHPVNDVFGIGWRLGTHRQGDLYRRSGLSVSIFGVF